MIHPTCPTAEEAADSYPDRFSYVLRINRMDPDFRGQVKKVKESNGGRAIRLIPGMDPREVQAFADGDYDELLGVISDLALPLFLHLPDHPELIRERAEKFPDLQIIVDHCGLFNNAMRAMNPAAKPLGEKEQYALYDQILGLSDLPNVGIKWRSKRRCVYFVHKLSAAERPRVPDRRGESTVWDLSPSRISPREAAKYAAYNVSGRIIPRCLTRRLIPGKSSGLYSGRPLMPSAGIASSGQATSL